MMFRRWLSIAAIALAAALSAAPTIASRCVGCAVVEAPVVSSIAIRAALDLPSERLAPQNTVAVLDSSTGAVLWEGLLRDYEQRRYAVSGMLSNRKLSNRLLNPYCADLGTTTVTTFNSGGTYNVPACTNSVEVLVVAGAGAGGSGGSAGGGAAGGYKYDASFSVTPGAAITVTVGSGGSPGADVGGDGTASSFGALSCDGGGGGGGRDLAGHNPAKINGHNGGSGGGGGTSSGDGTIGTGGTATGTGGCVGNNGGTGRHVSGSWEAGGGGGGCGSAGNNGTGPPGVAGTGGTACSNSITGSSVAYAAGGGASGGTSSNGGSACAGNGSAGTGGNGGANTGCGGGGGAGTGGSGGSGKVVVKAHNYTSANPPN